MPNMDEVKKWLGKEALIIGSQIGFFVSSAEIGSPLLYVLAEQGTRKAAPMSFSFSIRELAAMTAVGYPIMTTALRLPVLRSLRFTCANWDDDIGQMILITSANYLLGPASLALGAAILDIDGLSAANAFMFGLVSPWFGVIATGLTGYAIYGAYKAGAWIQENGCCIQINFSEFPRNNPAPVRERPQLDEIHVIEPMKEGELSFNGDRPQPIIFSGVRRNPMDHNNENVIPPAANELKEDIQKRSRCTIL